MPSDYEYISSEHRLDYGRKLTVWAQDHLANRYSDRTHFIFELLQNAEDALRERGQSEDPTSVAFNLGVDGLEVRHYGKSFSPENVKSICAINESTKKLELTEIGRFGIGFKSVYAFTKLPEVHSGDEHFAIENFVLPVAVDPVPLQQGETIFWLPFNEDDSTAVDEISAALKDLGCRRLLFLKSVTEISWALPDGTKGVFLKSPPSPNDLGQSIQLIGEVEGDAKPVDESWLLFSRRVATKEGVDAGCVEIAYLLEHDETGNEFVSQVADSKLAVFFPTEVSTGLGFLIQGPYRTTPSRDVVPPNDEWNKHLISETATLLHESLVSLKARGLLVPEALQVLPIDSRRYGVESMFRPLFERVLCALREEELLPAFGGGHVSGEQARLARGEGVRELFSPVQLGNLLGEDGPIQWLSEEITRDRASTLREFLMQQVGVKELTPESLASRLTGKFLEAQPDEWIGRLYEFLGGQKALRVDLLKKQVPIIRCEDGTHVAPFSGGIPQVFLPSDGKTGFRTVRRSVCATDAAAEFLKTIGLDEPDPVDDVIQNVLKSYEGDSVVRSDADYDADLLRIRTAFSTDSELGRKKLIEALRKTQFVRAVNAGTGEAKFLKPASVYRRTNRIAAVFDGVDGAWLVDGRVAGLKGEAMRDLLQACGALDVLRTMPCESDLSQTEKELMRRKMAYEPCSWERTEGDADCVELGGVVAAIESDSEDESKRRAAELWALVRDTLRDRRESYFQATYKWGFSQRSKQCEFPAAWVRRLQSATWVPDKEGRLSRPRELCVSEVGSEIADMTHPFLTEILGFRAEAIKELAEKEGIDLETLNLLKRHNVSAEGLRKLLGDAASEGDEEQEDDEATAEEDGDGENDGTSDDDQGNDGSGRAKNGGNGNGSSSGAGGRGGGHGGGGSGNRRKPKGEGDGRKSFHTYVGVENDDPEHHEGLSQQERLNLENAAIEFILGEEPNLQRTPTNNPGFDLYEGESLEFPVRFVEVKALKGEWNRPVAMSETQFQLAEAEQERYFLYIVEKAGDTEKRKLHRISDPAGTAKYFCFDPGWRNIAEHQTS